MTRVLQTLLLLGGWLLLTAADEPILVPDVSQHTVAVNQDFKGTELLLYGAVMTPEGTRTAGDTDIAVVLEGPERPVVLRQPHPPHRPLLVDRPRQRPITA